MDLNSILGFFEDDKTFLDKVKVALERHNLAMPMLCCSPDFTQPDPLLLEREIEREKRMIEITAFFGGRFAASFLVSAGQDSRGRTALLRLSGSSRACCRLPKSMVWS